MPQVLLDYTVHLRLLTDHEFSHPIAFRCKAKCAAEAEEIALTAQTDPQAVDVMLVLCETSYEVVPPIPTSQIHNVVQYTPSELKHLLRVATGLLTAYRNGGQNGQMAWEDLDRVHAYLQENLPRLVTAHSRELVAAKIEPYNADDA